jgi:hypothetical protein
MLLAGTYYRSGVRNLGSFHRASWPRLFRVHCEMTLYLVGFRFFVNWGLFLSVLHESLLFITMFRNSCFVRRTRQGSDFSLFL